MSKALNLHPNIPEKTVINLLNELFPKEYKYVGNFKFWLGGKNPDIMNVNGQKKLIEVFGDYWHRGENPQNRIRHFKKYGFDTLVIWEKDIKNDDNLMKTLNKFHKK
jgi:G:T-mismatch repair DNA endonuclease (very short patch repair protein)